jgi:ribosome-associated protein
MVDKRKKKLSAKPADRRKFADKRAGAGAKASKPARGAKRVGTAAGPRNPGKPAPEGRSFGKPKPGARNFIQQGAKAPQKSSRFVPGKGPVLRKPAPRGPVDLGIGAVEIAPPKDAPRTIGIVAAEAAMDKKAFDIVVLDVRGISGLCDEMVVASARSVTHLGAVCDAVEEALRKQGERVLHSDGRHAAEPDWILLDYGDLMVHLFRPEARDHTRLEDYYASARLVAKWKND